MRRTQYVDEALLDEYIDNSGLKVGYIADTLGITHQAFNKKRRGKSPFKAAEVYVLCDLCKIPDSEKEKIFCF